MAAVPYPFAHTHRRRVGDQFRQGSLPVFEGFRRTAAEDRCPPDGEGGLTQGRRIQGECGGKDYRQPAGRQGMQPSSCSGEKRYKLLSTAASSSPFVSLASITGSLSSTWRKSGRWASRVATDAVSPIYEQ